MPYIKQVRRQDLADGLYWFKQKVFDEGELNFIISSLVKDWVGSHPTYSTLNAAIGVLECAKQEIYRRMVVPYEEDKCRLNGDVF